MGNHDHLWNDMPIEERRRLSPYMIETQILHLEQARAVLAREQARVLRELDNWIANCRDSLRREVAEHTANDRNN